MEDLHIFSNPIALVDYAIVLGGALVFTHKRFQEHCDTSGLGRLVFAFFGTFFAMAFTAAGVGAILLGLLFFILKSFGVGVGLAILFAVFGPAICLFFAAICSLILGSYISRLFWKKEYSDEG